MSKMEISFDSQIVNSVIGLLPITRGFNYMHIVNWKRFDVWLVVAWDFWNVEQLVNFASQVVNINHLDSNHVQFLLTSCQAKLVLFTHIAYQVSRWA